MRELPGGYKVGDRVVYLLEQGLEVKELMGTVVGGGTKRVTVRLDKFRDTRVLMPTRLRRLN